MCFVVAVVALALALIFLDLPWVSTKDEVSCQAQECIPAQVVGLLTHVQV